MVCEGCGGTEEGGWETDMERSEVGVAASSSTAEVEGGGCVVWSCWIWDCCWRIMLRRRFCGSVSSSAMDQSQE